MLFFSFYTSPYITDKIKQQHIITLLIHELIKIYEMADDYMQNMSRSRGMTLSMVTGTGDSDARGSCTTASASF